MTSIDEPTLKERIEEAYSLLSPCRVCPRQCKVERLKGEKGFCKAGILPEVASYHPHFGEEPPISGWRGSGTIFFTHCSLRCVFCQNFSISQLGEGQQVSLEELAKIMIGLQEMGCHNINLVTPTHYTPQILSCLLLAKGEGLRVPIVYNCGGYESLPTLRLLEGIIDIYMPDFKYGDNSAAERLSSASDYVEVAKEAHREMHRQVGDLVIEKGVAKSGLLVRHLVLPNDLACSRKVFSFIAKDVSPETAVNVMAQYYPAHRASQFPEIDRRITSKEYSLALKEAKAENLGWGWRQNLSILFRQEIPEWKDDLRHAR